MAESCEIRDLLGSDSSGSDFETDREELTGPPEPKRSRKAKHTGAAKYRTKFNSDWKKEFPFVTSVPQDPYR